MIVVDYDGCNIVKFYCDDCNFHGEYDINNLISDNCAVDVDVICDLCGDLYILYVLRCKDEALADELNARLKVLKYNRDLEDEADGNKDNGKRGN